MFNKLSSFPSDIWPTGPDDFESSRHDQLKKKWLSLATSCITEMLFPQMLTLADNTVLVFFFKKTHFKRLED